MKTFCRLCEVNCGLEADVDDSGRLVDLKPDRAHPVTRGFACHKGLLARDIHFDPDRLDTPQRRNAQGFERSSWDEALPAIASRLSEVLDQHGPQSIALYMGNPSAFNALGSMSAGMFAASLGTERLFNAGTQDSDSNACLSWSASIIVGHQNRSYSPPFAADTAIAITAFNTYCTNNTYE